MDATEDDPPRTPASPTPQRPRSSIPSFLFITFLLFMLTNHSGDEFLARNTYQNALQSLNYQLGNFTAWIGGRESDFVLPEKHPSMEPLLSSLLADGTHLDPSEASYYSNITGFIRGDITFYNISLPFLESLSVSPSSSLASPTDINNDTTTTNLTSPPPWLPHAESLMSPLNTSEVIERASSWNWTGCDKIALSVVEKAPIMDGDKGKGKGLNLTEEMTVVHGHIDLMNTESSTELRLDFEGVHFVGNGSIYGFAEPAGRQIDIRLLPSLVPTAFKNDTARLIEPQLRAQIERLKGMIDAGVIDQDSQSDPPKSTCPFTLHLNLHPTSLPLALMRDLEDEIQHPTGRWTPTVSGVGGGGGGVRVSAVLVSEGCGVLGVVGKTEGLSSQSFFRKVTTDAGLSTTIYLLLLILLSRQTDLSRTPAGISRVSRWSFLTQSIVDSVSFAGHITFAILADGRPSLSLVGPAFLACMLFAYEAQFALLIHQIQAPEDAVPSPPPAPAAPTPTPTGPTGSLSLTPAEVPTSTPAQSPPSPPAPTPILTPTPASTSILSSFVRHIRTDPHSRLWLTMFIFLSFIVRVIVSPSMTLLFVGSMYSFFWMPQIIRSARRGRSSGLTVEYLVGTTVCRLYFALYFLACPKNVLDVEPRSWIYLLAIFMFLQVFVVILQERLGPAFFLPKRFVKAQTYDYHPPMPLPDSESPEHSLGNCAICMDAIILDTPTRRRSKSTDECKELGTGGGGGGLLNAMQMGVVGARAAKKNYSLAPCHHLFHTECLERWLAIKNICPQCRRPLPPL
ncbi:hypothetical protein PILCRDRAFT_819938 [Piloderma croceum F 1598]|uniref:RING-type E3 ubiquitin transferase n=1 Tax=Piloderma croceum (strain F 1598) TaxID=765440 RepID=A0A0C3C0S3_PILCF|nr:hypothetical protein PILCRDRAFT_819938 [Piloderma croceum F 1598]